MAEHVCPEYVCADLSERPGCKVSPYWERRERVTRCRDCVSYRPGGTNHEPRCERSVGTFVPNPDGFCAWGKPREGA